MSLSGTPPPEFDQVKQVELLLTVLPLVLSVATQPLSTFSTRRFGSINERARPFSPIFTTWACCSILVQFASLILTGVTPNRALRLLAIGIGKSTRKENRSSQKRSAVIARWAFFLVVSVPHTIRILTFKGTVGLVALKLFVASLILRFIVYEILWTTLAFTGTTLAEEARHHGLSSFDTREKVKMDPVHRLMESWHCGHVGCFFAKLLRNIWQGSLLPMFIAQFAFVVRLMHELLWPLLLPFAETLAIDPGRSLMVNFPMTFFYLWGKGILVLLLYLQLVENPLVATSRPLWEPIVKRILDSPRVMNTQVLKWLVEKILKHGIKTPIAILAISLTPQTEYLFVVANAVGLTIEAFAMIPTLVAVGRLVAVLSPKGGQQQKKPAAADPAEGNSKNDIEMGANLLDTNSDDTHTPKDFSSSSHPTQIDEFTGEAKWAQKTANTLNTVLPVLFTLLSSHVHVVLFGVLWFAIRYSPEGTSSADSWMPYGNMWFSMNLMVN